MVKVCCLKYCYSESVAGRGISFHNISKTRKQYFSNLLPSVNITKSAVICSLHFKPDDFIQKGTRKYLRENAVPSVFPVSSLSKSATDSDMTDCEETESKMVIFEARGLMPPVFTPVNEDQSINYAVIPEYAGYLARVGFKSILVGGTTGEHMSLTVADRKKVIVAWMRAGKPLGLHIQVQVGGGPLPDVLELARYCEEIDVDSLLTLPELYFAPKDVSSLVSYVELVAEAAPSLPILYYHIPSFTNVTVHMPSFVAAATARIPNFSGIKFTSNDLSEASLVLLELKHGQQIFLGADTLLAPAALLGIKSSIGTTFNLFPQLAQRILASVESGDLETARLLQEKLIVTVEAHTLEGAWVPTMKAGMELATGIKVGPPLLPQKPITTEQRERIHSKLKALELCE